MASPTRAISIVVVCQHVQYQRYPDRHRRGCTRRLKSRISGTPSLEAPQPRKKLGVRWPRRCTTTEGPGLLAGVSDSAAHKRRAAKPGDRTLGNALVATERTGRAAASNEARNCFSRPATVSGLNTNPARLMLGAISFSRLPLAPHGGLDICESGNVTAGA
jgi:hypothetical protein